MPRFWTQSQKAPQFQRNSAFFFSACKTRLFCLYIYLPSVYYIVNVRSPSIVSANKSVYKHKGCKGRPVRTRRKRKKAKLNFSSMFSRRSFSVRSKKAKPLQNKSKSCRNFLLPNDVRKDFSNNLSRVHLNPPK